MKYLLFSFFFEEIFYQDKFVKIYVNHLSKPDLFSAKQELGVLVHMYIYFVLTFLLLFFNFSLFFNYFFVFLITLDKVTGDCILYVEPSFFLHLTDSDPFLTD